MDFLKKVSYVKLNETKIQNTQELLKTLERSTISCKDVTFRIFGFITCYI